MTCATWNSMKNVFLLQQKFDATMPCHNVMTNDAAEKSLIYLILFMQISLTYADLCRYSKSLILPYLSSFFRHQRCAYQFEFKGFFYCRFESFLKFFIFSFFLKNNNNHFAYFYCNFRCSNTRDRWETRANECGFSSFFCATNEKWCKMQVSV